MSRQAWSVGKLALALFAGVGLAGCARPTARAVTHAAPRFALASTVAPPTMTRASQREPLDDAPAPKDAKTTREPKAIAEARDLALALDRPRLTLPAGRSVVAIAIPARRVVSLGLFGPTEALLGFELVAPEAAGIATYEPLDEDGRLPRVMSFRAPDRATTLRAIVDVSAEVTLARIEADPDAIAPPDARALRLGVVPPRALVGIPAPASRDDGYLLGSPARYLFARVDVATLLLASLRQVRVRFRRDPIAIGDISQWNGVRPATDLGHPRHISHEGGRDADIALPANDGEPSTLRPHCTGVLVKDDTYVCSPGSERGVDVLRLAYFLGLLVDGAGGRVEKIFTDDAYIREIHRANEELRARRWIKDQGYAALGEDGILHASPWHVDHVHVRFAGEHAQPLW